MITPQQTLARLQRLRDRGLLSDRQFHQIHHMGADVNIQDHCDYLETITRYQSRFSPNYTVAKKLKHLEKYVFGMR